MSPDSVLRATVFAAFLGTGGWMAMSHPELGQVSLLGAWAVVAAAVLFAGSLALYARRPGATLLTLSLLAAATGVFLDLDVVPEATPGREWTGWLLAAGAAGVVVFGVWVWYGRRGSAQMVNRWAGKSRRNDGVATGWAILRHASWFAVRRRAKVVRPSTRQVSWWRRLRMPLREFATPVARVGVFRIWSLVEDVTLRLGGPRTGKSGELACRILDAPGAVIATSTRTDLLEVTGPVRAKRGPVHVFNPAGVGGLDSTITFDPLSGCENPTVAVSRAADLLSGVAGPDTGGDREFWMAQGRRVLAALMYAAALGGGSMRDVLSWVADPASAAGPVSRNLRRQNDPAWEFDAQQFLNTNDRTQSSICSTIMPALGWLTDATAAKAAESGAFDVEQLLDERGTVYMLGAQDAQTAPLVTALTGHIAREARRLAEFQPGGRLDPPLTLALDEAALICPIPLDNWTADMGGRGVTMHIGAQSRAQLRQRYGDTGAAAILNNTATLLIFGGTRDPDDLNAYSTLTCERDEEVGTVDADRRITSTTTRRVPVLSPGQIAQLPAGHVVVIRRGLAPAVGKTGMAWKRRDVRRAQRAARWTARLDRWAALRERTASRLAGLGETWDELFDATGERRTPKPSEAVEVLDVATASRSEGIDRDERESGWRR